MTKEQKQAYFDLYSGQEVITTDGEIFMSPSEYRDMVAHIPEHDWTEYYAVLKDVSLISDSEFLEVFEGIEYNTCEFTDIENQQHGALVMDRARANGFVTPYDLFTLDEIIEWGIVKIAK